MATSFKVVIVGGDSVGKTSIVKKIQRQPVLPNEESTVRVAGQNLPITIQSLNQDINLELYDLPGAERFQVMNNMYLRDTNAALIVYDSTNRESMEQAESWMQQLKETAPEQAVLALAGNKMDKPGKQVQMADGQGFARKHDIKIVSEVSATTGENINQLFQKFATAIFEKRDQFPSRMRETFKLARTDVNVDQVGGKKKGKCC